MIASRTATGRNAGHGKEEKGRGGRTSRAPRGEGPPKEADRRKAVGGGSDRRGGALGPGKTRERMMGSFSFGV